MWTGRRGRAERCAVRTLRRADRGGCMAMDVEPRAEQRVVWRTRRWGGNAREQLLPGRTSELYIRAVGRMLCGRDCARPQGKGAAPPHETDEDEAVWWAPKTDTHASGRLRPTPNAFTVLGVLNEQNMLSVLNAFNMPNVHLAHGRAGGERGRNEGGGDEDGGRGRTRRIHHGPHLHLLRILVLPRGLHNRATERVSLTTHTQHRAARGAVRVASLSITFMMAPPSSRPSFVSSSNSN